MHTLPHPDSARARLLNAALPRSLNSSFTCAQPRRPTIAKEMMPSTSRVVGTTSPAARCTNIRSWARTGTVSRAAAFARIGQPTGPGQPAQPGQS